MKPNNVYMYLVDENGENVGYMTNKKKDENLTSFYTIRNANGLPTKELPL